MDGILLINKEAGCTSFDVVRQCKKIFSQKSVGHTGTLDPNATGVLVVLLGKACKCLPFLSHDTKEYIAELRLGEKSDTGDIWGKVIEEKPVGELSAEQIDAVLQTFLGKSEQIPPMVSAIKVNGKKLYEYAREGKEVERKSREIEIFEMELLEYNKTIRFRCVCSSGTYIRTLCEDIAEKLDTVGCMASLIRTKVGAWSLDQCCKLESLSGDQAEIYTVTEVLSKLYPCIEVEDAKDVMNGKRLFLPCRHETVCVLYKQEALAIYERVQDGLYKSKRGLW